MASPLSPSSAQARARSSPWLPLLPSLGLTSAQACTLFTILSVLESAYVLYLYYPRGAKKRVLLSLDQLGSRLDTAGAWVYDKKADPTLSAAAVVLFERRLQARRAFLDASGAAAGAGGGADAKGAPSVAAERPQRSPVRWVSEHGCSSLNGNGAPVCGGGAVPGSARAPIGSPISSPRQPPAKPPPAKPPPSSQYVERQRSFSRGPKRTPAADQPTSQAGDEPAVDAWHMSSAADTPASPPSSPPEPSPSEAVTIGMAAKQGPWQKPAPRRQRSRVLSIRTNRRQSIAPPSFGAQGNASDVAGVTTRANALACIRSALMRRAYRQREAAQAWQLRKAYEMQQLLRFEQTFFRLKDAR